MFFVPQGPDFQWYYSNTLNAQPTTGYGTIITPGTTTNIYGAWAQVATAANMAQDTYGVFINFNNGNTTGVARNILCEMGVDNAGGTSYQSVIPYLMASSASSFIAYTGGIWYYFPLYIKAGSSVAFRAMSNYSTTVRVNVTFYGQPRRPEAVRVGSYVDAFGVDTTNRAGTAITAGAATEGAWTQLGSATTKNYWWWQCGFGINNSVVNTGIFHTDLAAGNDTNKKILFENQYWSASSLETMANQPMFQNAYNNVASPNQYIYGRAQANGNTSGTTMIAYGLGG